MNRETKQRADQLLFKQESSSIVFSHENRGLRVEKTSFTPDKFEETSSFLLSLEEKEALLEYLLEEKASKKPTEEEHFNQLASKLVEHDATKHQPWSEGFVVGIRFATEILDISKQTQKKADQLRRKNSTLVN